MNIFKKMIVEAKEVDNLIEKVSTPTSTPEPEEEWVWVDGYKATDKDMQCRGYQYELNIQYDMPDDQEVTTCESGFHLCLALIDVFLYYHIGNGNRFFKVKALVRKTDKRNYKGHFRVGNDYYYSGGGGNNKLAAKSIIFLSELTANEILEFTDVRNLPECYKKMALETSVKSAVDEYCINTLLEDGYSKPFAAHIIKVDKFDIAHAFGSQKDLSMDMKVLGILYNS